MNAFLKRKCERLYNDTLAVTARLTLVIPSYSMVYSKNFGEFLLRNVVYV